MSAMLLPLQDFWGNYVPLGGTEGFFKDLHPGLRGPTPKEHVKTDWI